LAGVASLGIVVVDVREGGPDGTHIVVPVPLVLAQGALLFVPEEKVRVKLDRAEKYLPLARELVEALAQGPDGELVRVEEPGEEVVITKKGDTLEVRVQDKNDDVAVNIPLALAMAAVPDAHGRIRMADLAGALGSTRFTDLVDVQSGNDHVKVSVW
ncbi:MAG: hypothetical protein ACHQKZ_11125, partial [Solirubrobacterales bacterium]